MKTALALILLVLLAACGSTRPAAGPASATAQAPASSAPAAPATPQALPASTTAAAPAAPVMPAAEQQAVTAAQGYLNLGSGFSAESLLKQLTSSYGDGFAQSDAQFAINYLQPDWDAQAVLAAKGYLRLDTGFSRSSLIQQLTSSYGDGFPEAQAEYAASKVGL